MVVCEQCVDLVGERARVRNVARDRARAFEQRPVAEQVREPQPGETGLAPAEQLTASP